MPYWANRELHPRKGDTAIWDGHRASVMDIGDQFWVALQNEVQLKVEKEDWRKNFRYDFQQAAWVYDVELVKKFAVPRKKKRHLTK